MARSLNYRRNIYYNEYEPLTRHQRNIMPFKEIDDDNFFITDVDEMFNDVNFLTMAKFEIKDKTIIAQFYNLDGVVQTTKVTKRVKKEKPQNV